MSEEKKVELVVDGEVVYGGPTAAFAFCFNDGQGLQARIHGNAPEALQLVAALLVLIDQEAQGATLQLVLDALIFAFEQTEEKRIIEVPAGWDLTKEGQKFL